MPDAAQKPNAKKLIVFVCRWLVWLVVGALVTQILWTMLVHRYTQPMFGSFYGVLNANCYGNESLSNFNVRGETEPKWYWVRPSNFQYTRLILSWYGTPIDNRAVVELPSFRYQFGETEGLLTPNVLDKWFVPESQQNAATLREAEWIYGFLQSAANGTLPRPQHHTHSFDEPVHVWLQHFCCGFGFSSWVYVWCIIWLGLLISKARRL